MTRWFRFYDDVINDPKIIELPDDLYRAWTQLLCIASKNDGTLPVVSHIAIMLRTTVSCTEKIISELVERGLIDECRSGVLSPHNWRKRQYKSDISTDRVKQFRKRERNVSETPPDTEQIQSRAEQKDGGGDAERKAAFLIADEVGKLCGYQTPHDWPPGFCGAPHRVQMWVSEGWRRDIILSAVKESLSRKRDGPPDSINYFEKPIARAHAKASAPIPVVKILPAEQTEMRSENRGNILPAFDGLIDKIDKFNKPAPSIGGISEIRGGAGETPVRLISKG
jgi:hypothetical protein